MTSTPPAPAEPLFIPDLLCADARVRVDLPSLRQALVFAFAAGAPSEVFDEPLIAADLPPSTWRRSDFARDLYVDEIAEKCLAIRVAGKAYRACGRYVGRVLGSPPRDDRDVQLRRDVLAEVVGSKDRRAGLEQVYLLILKVRALLSAPRQTAPRVRRIEILRAIREVFELLASSFGDATSALARLRKFGAAVVASRAHRRLVDLLDHDEHLGSLDLRVRVGADGEVRALEIVRVEENTANPFHLSALRRFWTRVVLFLRGFRTTPGEIAERLLSEVFSGVEEPVALLFQLMGDIEVVLGAIGFRDQAAHHGLPVCLAELTAPETPLELDGLFNPLLLVAGMIPKPCDVRTGPNAIAIVTGPNSGGKTRLLQALGIAQLLAQAGLFTPARRARIPSASGLFASLFEEARSDQPEGHLGMELLRIRKLFEDVDAGGLVVLDELCSGTNPSEGEEIARLVLSLLPELGVRAFVTTHLLQFAAGLLRESSGSRLEFLQVELDASERPTYQFVPGVARTSLAHKTAARLGVTREELLARIAAKRRVT
ncbi:MAG TPA: DNA mismatch repair protein [Polyangiaceae bacterium]|nr:DNA mismatch repair protein [Polyangiaceae bacterium]